MYNKYIKSLLNLMIFILASKVCVVDSIVEEVVKQNKEELL
jgi:hypothetical protein